jgi:hypothetical protein
LECGRPCSKPSAFSDATAAISASPKNGEAFFLRGEAKVRLSDLQGAAADLRYPACVKLAEILEALHASTSRSCQGGKGGHVVVRDGHLEGHEGAVILPLAELRPAVGFVRHSDGAAHRRPDVDIPGIEEIEDVPDVVLPAEAIERLRQTSPKDKRENSRESAILIAGSAPCRTPRPGSASSAPARC